MSYMFRVTLALGYIVEIIPKTDTVKRYNEITGDPYDKEIKIGEAAVIGPVTIFHMANPSESLRHSILSALGMARSDLEVIEWDFFCKDPRFFIGIQVSTIEEEHGPRIREVSSAGSISSTDYPDFRRLKKMFPKIGEPSLYLINTSS